MKLFKIAHFANQLIDSLDPKLAWALSGAEGIRQAEFEVSQICDGREIVYGP